MSTAVSPVAPTADRAPRVGSDAVVWLVAAATVLLRLPLVGLPATSDEGGLLLLSGHWGPGSSLYGDYWVDRPPLLVGFFALAAHLGGPGQSGVLALRLLGLVLVAASVVAAGRLARIVVGSSGPTAAPVCAAVVAAVLLCQARFGAFQVDGELVAVPLVLAGLASALGATRAQASGAGWRLVAAGACAAGAALVKQNEIDVAIFLVVAAPGLLRRTPLPVGRALGLAGLGAVATVGVTVVAAALRGSSPRGLWEAVVTFRWEASQVIAVEAGPTTTERLHVLLLAVLLTGVPLLLWAWARGLVAAPVAGALDLRLPTAAVLAWETFSVLAGGSYWHHYLICLVPGLVLAEAQGWAGWRGTAGRRLRRHGPVLAVLAVLCAWPLAAMYAGVAKGTHPDATVTWLRTHARPGDTAVVAFGRPDIVYGAGLSSPYPELWSLPVRVRDPRLLGLTAVLTSPDRPTWIVTGPGGDLSGWGIDDLAAEPVFRSDYVEVADLGATRIFHVRDAIVRPVGGTITG